MPVIPRPVPDAAWLATRVEEAIEPELPIVDPHHHLWDRDGGYLPRDILEDTASGHRIVATVYVECGSGYLDHGPWRFRPVGETEFAAGVHDAAAASCRVLTRLCAGIVGYADLELGDAVVEVLEKHIAAGHGRFRGIRCMAARSEEFNNSTLRRPPANLLSRPAFRRGLVQVQRLGLSFDAWVYHTQLHEVLDLACSMPRLPIVVDHLGGPLGVGSYEGKRDEVFRAWRQAMAQLAGCPNVSVKLGGLGIAVCGFGFHRGSVAPSSEQLAAAWAPFVHTTIELFGARRCMFESNFPVDKGVTSYGVLWNAFKRMASGASTAEKSSLFSDTAAAVYRLPTAPER